MVMPYSHAKIQGQKSVSSKDRVKTNGRMEANVLLPLQCISNYVNLAGTVAAQTLVSVRENVCNNSKNLKTHVFFWILKEY